MIPNNQNSDLGWEKSHSFCEEVGGISHTDSLELRMVLRLSDKEFNFHHSDIMGRRSMLVALTRYSQGSGIGRSRRIFTQ